MLRKMFPSGGVSNVLLCAKTNTRTALCLTMYSVQALQKLALELDGGVGADPIVSMESIP